MASKKSKKAAEMLAAKNSNLKIVDTPLDYIPVYVKSGTTLPLVSEIKQNTVQGLKSKIMLKNFGSEAVGYLYIDDGLSLDFKSGKYAGCKILYK